MANPTEMKELIVEQQLKIRQLEFELATLKETALNSWNKLVHMQQWHRDNPDFPKAAMATICEVEAELREIN